MARIDVQINQPMGAALFKGSADLLRLNTDRSIWVRMAENRTENPSPNPAFVPEIQQVLRYNPKNLNLERVRKFLLEKWATIGYWQQPILSTTIKLYYP